MQLNKLRLKTLNDLNDELFNLFREKFNLNIQKSTNKLKTPHLLKIVRKNIARIKTLISEKKRGL